MRKRINRWLTIGTIVIVVGAILILPRILGDALYPIEYEAEVDAAAAEFNVDKALILAVILSESRFKPTAKSHAGATGLMQLMPGTGASLARTLGISSPNLADPATNIRLGTFYLSQMLKRYNNNVDLALMAYNAGPGGADRYLRNGTLPRETNRYYQIVSQRQQKYTEILAEREAQKNQQSSQPQIVEPEVTGVKRLFGRWFSPTQ